MGDRWLKKRCAECDGFVYFLSSWRATTEYCDLCLLSKIEGLGDLLQGFLRNERSLLSLRLSIDERHAHDARQPLRLKVAAILQVRRDLKKLIRGVLTDKELKKLVFRLEKERRLADKERLKHKSKKKLNKNRALPLEVMAMYQGGAPGLGKRS